MSKSSLMLPSTNPYASPKSDSADSSREGRPDGSGTKPLYAGWLAVFALNLIVPLSVGWMTTELQGRMGMLLAALMLLALGFWICSTVREVGFALVVGAVAVGLLQALPVLQFMACLIGFALAEGLGLLAPAEVGPPSVRTLAAGFIVAMTTGGLLAAASIVAGLVIRAVLSLRRRRSGFRA